MLAKCREAEVVRREWLTTFLSRKTLPKDATAFVAIGLTRHGVDVSSALAAGNRFAAVLLGLPEPEGYWSPSPVDGYAEQPGKAGHAILAVVLAGMELATGRHTWRNPTSPAVRYFEQIPGNLRSGVATLDKAKGTPDLAIGDASRASAEVLPCVAALADRVDDPLPLDIVLHLRESRHDREEHRSHRRRGVHVATTEVQHAKASAAVAEPSSEVEHILRRSSEPVQSCDDEGVPCLERREGVIELRA